MYPMLHARARPFMMFSVAVVLGVCALAARAQPAADPQPAESQATSRDAPDQQTAEQQPADQPDPAPPPVPPPPAPEPLDPRFATPSATLQTFGESIQRAQAEPGRADRHLRGALECLDASLLPDGASLQAAEDLWNTLIRIGFPSEYQFPSAEQIGDRTSFSVFPWSTIQGASSWYPRRRSYQRVAELDIPEGVGIRLTLQQDGWKFDSQTVQSIDQLYRAVEHIQPLVGYTPLTLTKAGWLRSQMPDWARDEALLGLEWWVVIGIGVLIFLGLLLDRVARLLMRWGYMIHARRRGVEPDAGEVASSVRPFGLAFAGVFWYASFGFLKLPPDALDIIRTAVQFFLMLATVWAAYRLTDLVSILLTKRAERSSNKIDDLLIPLLRKTAKVLITVLGVIYIADARGVEILPLLTGLGIGGIAFGLAAKDTVENFFGSIAVIADRPFEVGDWVQIGDVEGTIENLGLRSTRIRTFYNSLVTVPNATLVRATVDNYGRRRYRRFYTTLSVTYDTHPDTIESFCSGVRQLVRAHPYTRKDYYHVWLNNFGSSSLDIILYVFFITPDWSTELRERHRLMLDIIRLADQLGVEFAFPTQTLHMYQHPPGEEHVPGELPGENAERKSRFAGRRAAREVTKNAPWQTRVPDPVVFDGNVEEGDGPELSEEERQAEAGQH